MELNKLEETIISSINDEHLRELVNIHRNEICELSREIVNRDFTIFSDEGLIIIIRALDKNEQDIFWSYALSSMKVYEIEKILKVKEFKTYSSYKIKANKLYNEFVRDKKYLCETRDLDSLYELTTRTQITLIRAGILCVSDLEKYTIEEISNIRHIGKTTLKEILSFVESRNIKLKETKVEKRKKSVILENLNMYNKEEIFELEKYLECMLEKVREHIKSGMENKETVRISTLSDSELKDLLTRNRDNVCRLSSEVLVRPFIRFSEEGLITIIRTLSAEIQDLFWYVFILGMNDWECSRILEYGKGGYKRVKKIRLEINELIENYKDDYSVLCEEKDSIRVIDMSNKEYNSLYREGIRQLSELENYTKQELLSIKSIGIVTANKIIKRMEENGMYLKDSNKIQY